MNAYGIELPLCTRSRCRCSRFRAQDVGAMHANGKYDIMNSPFMAWWHSSKAMALHDSSISGSQSWGYLKLSRICARCQQCSRPANARCKAVCSSQCACSLISDPASPRPGRICGSALHRQLACLPVDVGIILQAALPSQWRHICASTHTSASASRHPRCHDLEYAAHALHLLLAMLR